VGSLSLYLQARWGLGAPVAAANITWSEDWWNPDFPDRPQISISDVASPRLEAYNTGGSVTYKYRPVYYVNCWQQVARGGPGTQEMANVQAMRQEVARVFRTGKVLGWGGSLPFGVALPLDAGTPLHDRTVTPRVLRYQLTLVTTLDNEPG